jgi:hypothetical protein
MGDGAEPERVPSRPSREPAQYRSWRDREEDKARREAWMKGLEPVEKWEQLGDGKLDFILYMAFPMTAHDVICFDLWLAYDVLLKAERLRDWGRLVLWCFGCQSTECGACRWAERVYRKGQSVRKILAKDDDDDLPF